MDVKDLIERVASGARAEEALTEGVSLPSGFAAKIAKMTDRNLHSEADLEIAKAIKFKKIIPALQGLIALHTFYGYNTPSLDETSHDLYKKVMAYARSVLSAEDYQAIHDAK